MKRLLLLACLAPLAALAEPLSYDYVYLSSNDSSNDDSAGGSGEAFGGFYEFAQTLHLFGSYDDSSAYIGAGQNPNWDYDTKTLRFGIGGHYLLGERTMIAPSIAVLRSRRDITAPLWTVRDEDTGYGAQIDLRHAFTNWFEVTAGARYSEVFEQDDTEFVAGIVFHPTNWLALGAVHHEGDERTATELTIKWYY